MNTFIPAGSVPAYPAQHVQTSNGPDDARHAALRQAANDLEAAFLTEMLKSAGLGKARDAFGGGAGEDHFSSLLVREQAEAMTRAGGIGLAESLFNSLLEAENGPSSRTRSD